jgi:hypothetical protein
MRSLFYNVIVFSFGTKVFGVSDDVIHKVNTVTAKSATDLSIISIKKNCTPQLNEQKSHSTILPFRISWIKIK